MYKRERIGNVSMRARVLLYVYVYYVLNRERSLWRRNCVVTHRLKTTIAIIDDCIYDRYH